MKLESWRAKEKLKEQKKAGQRELLGKKSSMWFAKKNLKTYNPTADLVLKLEETPKKSEVASKKRKHQEVESTPSSEPAEEATEEYRDKENERLKKKNKKDNEESPAFDAYGEKKKKKKPKETEELLLADADGKKKKYDAQNVSMETEDSSKKDKKKEKKGMLKNEISFQNIAGKEEFVLYYLKILSSVHLRLTVF